MKKREAELNSSLPAFSARASQLHRRLDFWLGVPAIAAAGILRRHRQLPSSPQRIGFLSPTAIGDLILDTGLLRHVAQRYPGAELHIFHGRNNREAIALLPVPVVAHLCDFQSFRRTLLEIRHSRLDMLVDLTPWPRLTALYAALSGTATVGFNSLGQYRHFAFDIAVPHMRARHEVENLKAMAHVFGECPIYEVRISDAGTLPELPVDWRRLVLCHAAPGGSRSQWKRWPNPFWVELIRALVSDGHLVGLTGTDSDQPVVNAILAQLHLPFDRVLSLCGRLTLLELAAALRACRLCITVDTGVMHLASAVDAATIALLGPTHSTRWGARSSNSVNLDSPHPKSGFIHLGFERSRHGAEIMTFLRPHEVIGAARALLGRENGRGVSRQ